MTPNHNTGSIFVGTGEFSFCRNATTRAETKLKGFRDFDNVMAFTPEINSERVEHEGSYRGLKRVDEIFGIKQGFEYLLKCDAFTYDNISLLLQGESGTHHTQSAFTETAADVLGFSVSVPSDPLRWYDLYRTNAHVRSLTSTLLFVGTPVAATTQDSGDTFTSNAHGLANGDRVILVTLTTTTGISTLVAYFVVGSTTNTFQLSATSGGSAIALTTNGSATFLEALGEGADSDYELDDELGRIRLTAVQTTSCYVYLTGAAITSSDSTYMKGIKPLEDSVSEGYGRFVTFHQKTEKPYWDHQDFSCTVIAEKIDEVDGKKPPTFQLRVRVTTDEGNCLIASRGVSSS